MNQLTRKLQKAIEELEKLNKKLGYTPKYPSELSNKANYIIIQKGKYVSRRKWEETKFEMIEKQWVYLKDGYAKLINPSETVYFKLEEDAIGEVRNAREKDGALFCRKAMMGCGFSRNLCGQWEVKQLNPHLKTIVRK